MKAANETSASLADAVYYDITDSARLEAKWENHKNSEINTGRGPMPVELLERSSRRQIGRAKRFTEENETTNESFNTGNAPTSNSQPQPQLTSPKIEKKTHISTACVISEDSTESERNQKIGMHL